MTREEAIEVYNGLINKKIKEAFEFFAPELAESEDERTRKYIVNFVELNKGTNLSPDDADRMLAYLERQKAQKPAWSDIDKGILKDAITAADLLGNNEDYKKEHPHLAKAFRIAKNWLEHLPERLSLQPKQEWSEEDELMRTAVIQTLETFKERGTTEMQIEWLKSLRPQLKQEWSKIDEQISNGLIKALENLSSDWLKLHGVIK